MRYLGMHKQNHQYWLDIMTQSKYLSLDADSYNEGPLVDELETRIAALLGQPNALFFNKGTTCQLAALKAHCDAKNNHKIMLHPQSHIAFDEQDAYQSLMGLKGVLVGASNSVIKLKDVQDHAEDVAVLVIELPLRRAGFKLPKWAELIKLRQWCDENQVTMHLDGARIWESAAFYGCTWASIADIFDSVYVSLYKGIGGMGGAVLTGDADFIANCTVWRERLGSNMWTTFPTLITALEGLDKNLNQISQWVKRAQEIAAALGNIDGLDVDTPQTNGFQIKTQGNVSQINKRLKTISNKMKISPCKPFVSKANSKNLYTEIQVGALHQQIKTQELVHFFNQLMKSS